MSVSSAEEKGYAKVVGADTKSGTKMSAGLTPEHLGHPVRWWKNGWRHGVLVKVGPKWAHVEYVGHIKRLPLREVELEQLLPHP